MTIVAGIDIETTGLLTPDHRIIEVYIGLYRDGKKLPVEYNQRLDPMRSIGAEAERVHHINGSMLIGCPTLETEAPKIVSFLAKADLHVWHNGDDFDGPFLTQELARCGQTFPKRPALDTMVNGVWATPDGKKPRLEELCFACNQPYDKAQAHAAAYDVDRMMDCYWWGRQHGFFAPPQMAGQLAAA